MSDRTYQARRQALPGFCHSSTGFALSFDAGLSAFAVCWLTH